MPVKPAQMKPGTKPMKRGAFEKSARIEKREVAKIKRPMKSKQRAVTAQEKVLWNELAGLGCIACRKDGRFNPHVSIHHVHGRTAPDCHKKVLALCAGHHQDNGGGLIAVHPWKARFEKLYGKQDDLIAESYKLIGLSYAT